MMSKYKMQLILEVINPELDSIEFDVRLEAAATDEAEKIFGFNLSKLTNGMIVDLTDDNVEAIKKSYGLSFHSINRWTCLRLALPIDDLPYKVHTRRELNLMLSGSKPLSVFYEAYPSNVDFQCFPESAFDHYVKQNLFIKREVIFLNEKADRSQVPTKKGMRVVLYSKKSEEWRIDAMLLLRITSAKTGWNEGFERMEGSLLGYEEWQNNAYIEQIYKKNK